VSLRTWLRGGGDIATRRAAAAFLGSGYFAAGAGAAGAFSPAAGFASPFG